MIVEEEFSNKNQLNKILKKVDTIQGKAIIDTKNKTISAKFSATITGDFMPNDGFTEKQLEQLGLVMDAKIQPVREDIKEIKERLDVLEEDMKNVKKEIKNVKKDMKNVKKDIELIKNCPTIQKEIKED